MILKLQSVKIGGSLARNARFGAPTFRRVYGKSCKTCLFGMFQNVKIGGCFARNARCGAPAAKPLLFEGFQAGCHVVLRGRRGTV